MTSTAGNRQKPVDLFECRSPQWLVRFTDASGVHLFSSLWLKEMWVSSHSPDEITRPFFTRTVRDCFIPCERHVEEDTIIGS